MRLYNFSSNSRICPAHSKWQETWRAASLRIFPPLDLRGSAFRRRGGPLLDGGAARPVQQLAVPPVQLGIGFPQLFHAVIYPAAAGRGEGHERLAPQVVALDERVDDSWGLVPPDGIADEDDIVGGDVQPLAFQRGARRGVVHLHRAARPPVVPVKVGGGVGLPRGYTY